MTKRVLLSFDVEEFDLPSEYGLSISPEEGIAVTSEGLVRLLRLLDSLDVQATCFVTAKFAQSRPDLMAGMAGRYEIASHGLNHSGFKQGDLSASRVELERLTGKRVCGFRSPRLSAVRHDDILAAGYTYDSSENPIWLPGRYMNLFNPRLPYRSKGLLVLPISTSPVIRYPLFWLSFKRTPLRLFEVMSSWALNSNGYLNIFFHPWEFSDLSSWSLPAWLKNPNGEAMLKKLEAYLLWLKKKASFVTCADFASHPTEQKSNGFWSWGNIEKPSLK
ncbi:MAG: polysaccharide deacetylase family protein [Syntrophobacteraceae bacterium]